MVGKDLIMATLLGSGGGSSGSGGAAGVSPKEVNFYDYDGTCVNAYTVAEAQALSELPAGPEHPGLVFQGWNWSLDGVKGLTRAMNIGAMYTTDDGTTRLYITLQEGRTSPMLGVGVNGTVTVDWGDGTEPDVLSGTSVNTTKWTPNHAYAAPGDYVIRLTVDGTMRFDGDGTSYKYSRLLRHSSGSDQLNAAYHNALRKIEIGDGVSELGDNAFMYCGMLTAVSMPKAVSVAGEYAFAYCFNLSSVTIPSAMESISISMFQTCYGLVSVAMPEKLLNIGEYAFYYCYQLRLPGLPDTVTNIERGAFNYCWSIQTVALNEGVTSLSDSVFQNCKGLVSVFIPSSVTDIKTYVFGSCNILTVVDFSACTAVPTLAATSAFSGIPADCEIRVPAALYDEWIAATNWATYASKIKAY